MDKINIAVRKVAQRVNTADLYNMTKSTAFIKM